MKTITEIKTLLSNGNLSNDVLEILQKDERNGVKKLLLSYFKKQEKLTQLRKKYDEMLVFENDLKRQNIKLIAGIDEVGRGPLAGPVIAAAVILGDAFYYPGINDSKKLSSKKREEIYEYILENALDFGVGSCTIEEIDKYNIYQASKIAMKRAFENLRIKPEHLLIDAMTLEEIKIGQDNIIKGDEKSVSIAAASIVAKVTRDKYMEQMALIYPYYGFEKNAGYGTKSHLEALNKYGVTKIHRKTFEPVKSMLE